MLKNATLLSLVAVCLLSAEFVNDAVAGPGAPASAASIGYYPPRPWYPGWNPYYYYPWIWPVNPPFDVTQPLGNAPPAPRLPPIPQVPAVPSYQSATQGNPLPTPPLRRY